MKVLITGANGLLGQHLVKLLIESTDYSITATGKGVSRLPIDSSNRYNYFPLDITDGVEVNTFIAQNSPDVIIHTAAITQVDDCEKDPVHCWNTNVTATRFLVGASEMIGAKFIYISTDFVFNGSSSLPYIETDICDPINVYGASKLEGEKLIIATNPKHFVIRTSWLYSSFGNNFLKNMTRYAQERDVLNVIFEQVGTPTYAKDLAQAIQSIIEADSSDYGIYHYSNEGVASWYDFAKVLVDMQQISCAIHPILTAAYPTPAKRPAFSVLNKQKIKSTFSIAIPYWQDSLRVCIEELRKKQSFNQ
jgi:dTDP-4-dehydrorhamnose reductase